eukprot:3624927-Rhodomonas_salina.1
MRPHLPKRRGSPEEARSDEATARRRIGEEALPNDAACVRRGWAVRVLRIESEFRGRALDATVPLTSRTPVQPQRRFVRADVVNSAPNASGDIAPYAYRECTM